MRRAWPRGDWHVLLEFAAPSGALLAGQWFADAIRRAEVFAATRGAVDAPGHGVVLQPDGADRRLTGLAEVVAWPGSRLVVHRPEGRAVVQLNRESSRYYGKVVRRGSSATVAGRLIEMAEVLRGSFEVPRPLDWAVDDSIVVLSELPGPTLHEAGSDPARPDRELAAAWRALGAGLRVLHDSRPGPAGDRHDAAAWAHDAAAEVAVAARWLAAAAEYGLLPPVDAPAALAGLLAGPPGPAGLLHRDLHDKQVVLGPDGGLGLLDLDTLAVGERALDIANLLVHLELRVAQGALTRTRARAARAAFLAGLAPDPATLARVPAYERATRLRLAGVYAFRPRWRGLARALLASATSATP